VGADERMKLENLAAAKFFVAGGGVEQHND
jgi:hypothetical protein